MLLVFLCLACSKKDTANVLEKNFQDQIEINSNLSFTFDKDLVSDTLLNVWDTTELITFDPPIKGRFSWKLPNQLIFMPLRQMSPATRYQASFNEMLVANTGYRLGDGTSFEFRTPLLKLEQVNAYWSGTEDQPDQAVLQVNLAFNYQVEPQQLIPLLGLKIDEKAHKMEVMDQNINQELKLYLPNLPPEDKELKATLTLGAGLKPFQGQLAWEDSHNEELKIPSPFVLTIQDINADHDGVEGVITVATSQKVVEAGIKKYLTIKPAVDYDVQVNAQGFSISSEAFNADRTYDIQIGKGLQGAIGGVLKYESSQQISFGKLDPAIRFVNRKASYLSAQGQRNLEIRIINVPEVQVRITKIYENNIMSFLNSTQYYYDSEYGDYYDDYNYQNTSSQGDVVWEQTLQTKDLPRTGSSRLLKLNFIDKIRGYQGLYVVEVQAPDSYWVKSHKVVAISDIGLIAKKGRNSVTVFANSLESAQPMPNVELTLIGQNNQVIDRVKTDARGVATYQWKDLLASGFNLNLITARSTGDFNYLPFNKTRISQARFDVGGNYLNSAGYQAYVYGERDIYRPGETLNMATMVRSNQWELPGSMPLILKLITPNGQEHGAVRKILDDQGMAEVQFRLPPEAITGTYLLQVFTSNNVLLNTHSVAVEEFIPDRIKVNLNADKENYQTAESAELTLTATNLFGPPAANRNYEVEMSTNKQYFTSKEHPDYQYELANVNQSFPKVLRTGKTNGQGQALETFEFPNSYQDMGVLQADFFATVFDETGRPVNQRLGVNIYTQQVFYGIKPGSYYFATGRPIKFPLIAVNAEGNALNDIKAQVKVIKHEYKTVLSKSGNYFRYRSEDVEKVIKNQVLTLNGSAQHLDFTPDLSGRYEVRISKPGSNSYVSRSFYAYGFGSTSYSSFQVNNEGRVDITFDKDTYQVGDEAQVLLKAPFSGKILVTVERDEVLDHFYVDADKRSASFSLPITTDQVPNVYISATLFKPHKTSDLPLTVAHGFAPLVVENADYRIPLKVEASAQSRSGVKQKISIKGAPNSRVTVAVVDEGILQLTGFQSPNPYDYFFSRRALEVNTYDVYPYLFPELHSSRPGGDGMNLQKRINPLTNKRVKLVSFWSGVMETNNRGEATYEIDIPQFSGDLRIMAVAAKGKAFAGAQANMKVADPLVVSVALPRFFSPRDTVEVPVVLTNTTKKATNANASIRVTGPLQVLGPTSQEVPLAANAESRVNFKLVAEAAIGSAGVKVETSALGEKFKNDTDITVRPASPLQKVSGAGSIKAGSKAEFSMDTDRFMPASVDKHLILSKSPMVEFADDLDYLLRYPYGCVEQTVSSVFPQLYYPQLVSSLYKRTGEVAPANHHINEAIKRLQLMQLYHGGLTYWPGGGYESWWGSVYAAHFLLEARQNGYDVNEQMLKKLMGYLKQRLREKKVITYYFNTNQRKEIAPKEVAYSLFVLALADQPDKATMNYYKSRQERLSLDSRYLLAAAYALIGDQKKADEVRPAAFQGEQSNRVFGGSFYSMIRDEAIALYSLLYYDPDNLQVPVMAKHISQYLKSRKWLNTQERVFSFLALGKIAEGAAASDIQATIKVDGQQAASFDNKDLTLKTNKLKGDQVEIAAEGEGVLYYFWDAEGISTDGSYRQEDSFLKVRKKFFSRSGKEINSGRFKQNDLVVVQLSLQSAFGGRVENVVISDILPAGFEIENPRIGESALFDWIKEKAYPDYQDIRDDRINLFVTATPKTQYYYYVVRAVSKGQFQMGPVGADAMYDAEYHSYNGGGEIWVE